MKRVEIIDEAISGINIVPVIDVTLVLLVILLVISPVMNLDKLKVDLPQALTKETKDQNVTVSLTADGQVSVDNEIIPREVLIHQLEYKLKDRSDVAVIIRADKSLPYGIVESFLRTVNGAVGNRAVALATQQRSADLEPR